MQRELELIMEPSSGQVIKRSSFFGFNLDSNLDLVGFESSFWILWSWNIYKIRGDFVHILHHHFRGGGPEPWWSWWRRGGGPELAKNWWRNIWTHPYFAPLRKHYFDNFNILVERYELFGTVEELLHNVTLREIKWIFMDIDIFHQNQIFYIIWGDIKPLLTENNI